MELSRCQRPADTETQVNGGNWYCLAVSDNGIGFPEDLDFRKTESLGLKIVCTLTAQLNGSVAMERNGGSRFTILFREA